MSELRVAESNTYLIDRCERKFFYLADTAWSVFSNARIEEWEEYLEYRRLQNFNVLQISILPILHDTSGSDIGIAPFHHKESGEWDFYQVNTEFFERAETMVRQAKEKGFTPALVVLWCNYVPDSWASKRNPGYIMPEDAVESYVEFVGKTFGKYDPIFIVSGDTRFESQRVIEYYMKALKTIKHTCPDALTTLHLAPNEELPVQFVDSEELDFYMYQAGHHHDQQDFPYKLAQDFYRQPVKRPVINGEPCYEGHGHGFKYGRYNEFDIRKATWQSLLAGAKAGVTYGAHGVWSWHRKSSSFTSESFSGIPYEWQTGMRLGGAWDVSFAKWLFEQYNLFDIEPRNDLLLNESPEIRLAMGGGKVAVYCPYSVEVRVQMDLSHYEFILVNLTDRIVARPTVEIEDGYTAIRMHQFNSDALFIGVIKE